MAAVRLTKRSVKALAAEICRRNVRCRIQYSKRLVLSGRRQARRRSFRFLLRIALSRFCSNRFRSRSFITGQRLYIRCTRTTRWMAWETYSAWLYSIGAIASAS